MSKWIKVIILIILHAGAGYFLGTVCNKVTLIFPSLLNPDKELLNVLILVLVAAGVIMLIAGLVAALVRPIWIAIISFALTSAGILLGMGQYSLINIGLIAVYLIIGTIFSYLVTKDLKERIRFSIRPVSENKGLMILALLLLICGSIYTGGKDYIEEQGFEIPPVFFQFFAESMQEEALAQVPAAERSQQAAAMEEEFGKAIDEFQEKNIKPLEPYIPIAIAVMLFFSLHTVVSILSFVPMVLLEILIKLLQMFKITKTIKETQEVEQLVL